MSANFVHLHLHTEYSVLDGANKVKNIIERCHEYGMRACAITDHGCLFGAIDFYKSAKSAGIKPIIGSELYISSGKDRFDKSAKSAGASYYHLLLLCENEEGYHNLCRLSSLGYLEGYHYKPRVDDELLEKYHSGLIASSACLGGEVPQNVLNDDMDGANATIEKYVRIFGKDNFLIELMDHGMPEERKINPILVDLARQHGLKIIATNDSHYTDKADAQAHEALLCIQTGTTLDDEKRFRFPTQEFHFASPEEMKERFSEWPEALSNTVEVASRCDLEIPLGAHLIPKFEPPEGNDKKTYLHDLVFEGLDERYEGKPTPDHIERANFELEIIDGMGFTDYFLVVWDLISFARQSGIAVGPGRGSGAGSLVAFALKITNIDPIRYGLLFERFLNPERVSMPDFDLDFCYRRREEMIEYSRNKYGEANVSQIITFGRMLAKQVVRNVGRVLGMPYADVDRIAKLIPDELKITLASAVEKEPELKRIIEEEPQVHRLWELATRLEGTIGNCGTHAAGVIICDQPLTDHVALFKAPSSDTVATQAEMKCAEAIGLLKMDFLGLRTLTVVHDTVQFIKQNQGVEIAVDYLEPNDPKTYELLRSGKTTGVFQLESSGMRDLSKRIGLESLEEICALVALYRPGPMQFIDTYIENKYHPEKLTYAHPLLETILKETYGIALYQEQVMQIVQAVAGFSLGQADILRRAMGKKKVDLMAQQRSKFLDGTRENNIDEDTAAALFDIIEKFAGYGFNKSHSMAYAFVAYQTAFLKANYPVEFMAALLTSESGNLDKVAMYVDESRRIGVEVLPPDINKSYKDFAVEGDAIRFGMCAIKNVGEIPASAIANERDENGPYKDIFDFCCRLDTRQVNRRLIESLNKAGAFASTDWNRRQIEATLDSALSEGQIAQRERQSGQTSLFDLMGTEETGNVLHEKPDLDEWPENEVLVFEKEMMGLYVSGHPLARHADTLKNFSSVNVEDIGELRDGQEVTVGGQISNVKHHITSRGNKMAFVTLDTLEGPVEVTVFSDTFEEHAGLIVQDIIVMIPARVSFRNNESGLIAENIIPVEDAEKYLTKAIHIRLNTIGLDDVLLGRLAEILGAKPGRCDVYLHCMTPERNEVTVHATHACQVAPSPKLNIEIEDLLGENTIWYSGGNGFPRHNEDKPAPPKQPTWKTRQKKQG